MDKWIKLLSNIKTNQWALGLGTFILLLSIAGSIAGFTLQDDMHDKAYYAGLSIFMVGIFLSWYRAKVEAKKNGKK